MAPLDHTPSVVTEPEAPGLGVLPGTVLAGRYAVGDRLGEGGMAWVYLAYDVRLQRSVAVKVLKSHADSAAESRILREARAMAQLGHPNVLPVFDVGSDGGRSFIVMEYAAGLTLRGWLSSPRRRSEILRVFVGAGRGLEAAHAAGFVHRDFKPSNVMVDATGRPRVMDFGLVRNEASPSSSGTRTIGGVTMSIRGLERLTTTGTVMGTPAYMSPEQHGSEVVDARADQYAFCVALFEALVGELPYVADTMGELLARKSAGASGLPGLAKLPRRLVAVLVRGLASDPAARHRSMTELLDELEREASRERRPWGAVAAGAAIVAAAAAGMALAPTESACDSGSERLGDVWDEDRRAVLVGALGGVAVPFAAATAEATADRLDAWRDAWLAGYVDACEATHVRRDQSAERLDLRMACLADNRADAAALVAVLVDQPDAISLQRAVDATAALESPERCAAPHPGGQNAIDPSAAVQAEEIAAILADVRALDLAGRYEQGNRRADEAVAAATRLDHAPLVAEALLLRSRSRRDAGLHDASKEDLERAGALAVLGHDDAVMRAVAIDSIELYADYLQVGTEARHFIPIAQAWVTRTEAPANERGRFALASASAQLRAGDSEAAEAIARQAVVDIDRELGATHPLADRARNVLGTALAEGGQRDEARRWWAEARALRVARLGPAHPHVAQADNNIASTYIDDGEYGAALPVAERAVQVSAAALGEDHPEVAGYLVNLALVHEGLGDDRAALRELRRALGIQERTLGRGHAAVGRTLLNLGGIEARVDGPNAAAVTLERARVVLLGALGDAHPHVEIAEASLGQALHDAGRLVEAREHLERALRKAEARSSVDDPAVLALHMAVVGLAHESGRTEDAATELDALLARTTAPRAAALVHARPRLEIAKLMWSYFPARRDEALALGKTAAAIYAEHPDSGDVHAAEAGQWVAERAAEHRG